MSQVEGQSKDEREGGGHRGERGSQSAHMLLPWRPVQTSFLNRAANREKNMFSKPPSHTPSIWFDQQLDSLFIHRLHADLLH